MHLKHAPEARTRSPPPAPQSMASPGRGLLLALGLPLLPSPWDQASGQTLPGNENSTVTPTSTNSNGGLSQEAITAIIVVFSILGVLILTILLALLVWKLHEKRQTEGTYRPSSEEQVGARVQPPTNLKLPPEERLI